jgi:hypothetical protein
MPSLCTTPVEHELVVVLVFSSVVRIFGLAAWAWRGFCGRASLELAAHIVRAGFRCLRTIKSRDSDDLASGRY